VSKQAGGLGQTLGKVGTIAAGFLSAQVIGGGVQKLTGFLSDCTAKAEEQARVEAQLDAVLKSTGGSAGMTADEVKNLASELQKVTNYGDETTIAAENMLLTFTNIGKDVFPDTTKAVLDMSTAMGQDLQSTAVQVGKALQDPVEGVTALQRVGVRLTEQQKDQVAAMMDAGDAAGAQRVILAELNKEFGGSAEAAVAADHGMTQMSNRMGDMQEKIGMKLMPIMAKWKELQLAIVTLIAEKLVPLIQKLAQTYLPPLKEAFEAVRDAVAPVWEKIRPLLEGFSKNKDVLKIAAVIIGGVLVGAFAALAVSAGAAAISVIAATSPIIAIGAAIAAVVAVIYLLITHWDDVTAAVGRFLDMVEGIPVFGDMVAAVQKLVEEKIKAIIELFQGIIQVGKDVVQFFKDIFSGDWSAALGDIKTIGQDILGSIVDYIKVTFIGDIITALTSFVPWDAVKGEINHFSTEFCNAFTAVKTFLSDHWPEIATILSGPFAPLVALATDAFGVRTALQDGMDALKTYVSDRVGDIVGFFTDLPDRITGTVADILSAATGIGTSIADGVVAGLTGAVEGVKTALIDAMKGVWNALIQWMDDNFKISVPIKISKFGQTLDLGTLEWDPDLSFLKLAEGGILTGTRPVLAMLHPPEAVIPLRQGLMPAAAAAVAGGGTTIIHNHYIQLGEHGLFMGDRRELEALFERLWPYIQRKFR
jgi:phage-related protein